MNPKAFTAPQVFGRMDSTGDWYDRIFSGLCQWRRASKDKSRRNWIFCDGPVDATLIENLNMVLDDDKVLTLANGGRISVSPTVKCCSEPENHANASPPTVSRAGVIYISEAELTWQPVLVALLSRATGTPTGPRTPSTPPRGLADRIMPRFMELVDCTWEFFRQDCSIIMPTPLIHLITSSFWLLCGVVDEAAPAGHEFMKANVHRLFLFTLTRSFTGTLESCDRDKSDTPPAAVRGRPPLGRRDHRISCGPKDRQLGALEPVHHPLGVPRERQAGVIRPLHPHA